MSVVMSMRQHGYSARDVETALLDPAHGAGKWTRQTVAKKGMRAARAEMKRLIANADERIAERPAVRDRMESIVAVVTVRGAASACAWPGKSGTTDRVVLEAVCTLAERGGGPVFRASERQIAEHANVSRRTVSSSLPRLQKAGWLTKAASGEGERGTTWRLAVGTNGTAPVSRQGTGVTTGAVPFATLLAHDACSTGCLGASGARVLGLLIEAEDALTAAEIAEALGTSANTVRTRLRQIASAGLAVVASDRTWVAATKDEAEVLQMLDRLAWWQDRTGTQEARRERHEIDRAMYADTRAMRQRRSLRAISGGRQDVAQAQPKTRATQAKAL